MPWQARVKKVPAAVTPGLARAFFRCGVADGRAGGSFFKQENGRRATVCLRRKGMK
jgi:hypothetical protein